MIEYNGKDVIIMTCSNCNTKCKHCYIGYTGNFDGNDLYKLCLNLKNRYYVYLNGTEILLHEEYFKTLKLLKQKFLLTNGLKLYRNDILVSKLRKIGIEHIDMSYHFGIHDNLSSVAYQVICDNIDRLLKYGIRTELRTTITSENYQMIEQIVKQCYQMSAEGIKFTNFMKIGNADNMSSSNILSDYQLKVFFQQLRCVREKYDINKFRIRRCGSFGKDSNENTCNFRCVAGVESVAITPDLNVYPCLFLTSKGNEIGHIENGKILLNEKIYNEGEKCLVKELYNRR